MTSALSKSFPLVSFTVKNLFLFWVFSYELLLFHDNYFYLYDFFLQNYSYHHYQLLIWQNLIILNLSQLIWINLIRKFHYFLWLGGLNKYWIMIRIIDCIFFNALSLLLILKVFAWYKDCLLDWKSDPNRSPHIVFGIALNHLSAHNEWVSLSLWYELLQNNSLL